VKSRAIKIAEIITHEVFLKAEAYYYDTLVNQFEICPDILINYIEFVKYNTPLSFSWENTEEGWDGTYKGNKCQQDV
jgi:hypothetical protein